MENPYQSPTHEQSSEAVVPGGFTLMQGLRSLGLWTAICGVTAIPSFIWACNVVDDAWRVHAMSLGILLFAVAYTLLDLQILRSGCGRDPLLKRAVFTGFALRLTASAIFPLGMIVDVLPGMLSVVLVQAVWPGSSVAQQNMPAPMIFVVTLVQGVLLSTILWCCILMLYGLLQIFPGARRS
jgi:hypothetical protein